MKKSLAIMAAVSVLAIPTLVSAQFSGFGDLLNDLESAVKELKKPKPQAPPAQPRLNSSSLAQNPSDRVVLATETFRCRGESDATPIKLELEYLQARDGVRSGRFAESWLGWDENGGEQVPQFRRGTFRFSGVNYDLSYQNSNLGHLKLQVSRLDPEMGWVAITTKYDSDYPRIDDARTLTEYISPQREKDAEEAGGDTNSLLCELVKPIFSTESFEDYSVDDPDLFPERYDAQPALPQFAGRDAEFRSVRTMLTEAVTNYYDYPKFGKYYIAVMRGRFGAEYGYLIDMRSGRVSNFFSETINDEMVIDYSFRENSKLLLTITINDQNETCNINYSKLENGELVTFKTDNLGSSQICVNEFGNRKKEDYLGAIERRVLGN